MLPGLNRVLFRGMQIVCGIVLAAEDTAQTKARSRLRVAGRSDGHGVRPNPDHTKTAARECLICHTDDCGAIGGRAQQDVFLQTPNC